MPTFDLNEEEIKVEHGAMSSSSSSSGSTSSLSSVDSWAERLQERLDNVTNLETTVEDLQQQLKETHNEMEALLRRERERDCKMQTLHQRLSVANTRVFDANSLELSHHQATPVTDTFQRPPNRMKHAAVSSISRRGIERIIEILALTSKANHIGLQLAEYHLREKLADPETGARVSLTFIEETFGLGVTWQLSDLAFLKIAEKQAFNRSTLERPLVLSMNRIALAVGRLLGVTSSLSFHCTERVRPWEYVGSWLSARIKNADLNVDDTLRFLEFIARSQHDILKARTVNKEMVKVGSSLFLRHLKPLARQFLENAPSLNYTSMVTFLKDIGQAQPTEDEAFEPFWEMWQFTDEQLLLIVDDRFTELVEPFLAELLCEYNRTSRVSAQQLQTALSTAPARNASTPSSRPRKRALSDVGKTSTKRTRRSSHG